MPAEKKSDSNLNAALSYLWVISIIMLLTKKEDPFIQFHAKQGTVLFVATFIWIILLIGWILQPIVVFLVFIASVVGFIKAYQGEKYKLPLVGDLAEKINI